MKRLCSPGLCSLFVFRRSLKAILFYPASIHLRYFAKLSQRFIDCQSNNSRRNDDDPV